MYRNKINAAVCRKQPNSVKSDFQEIQLLAPVRVTQFKNRKMARLMTLFSAFVMIVLAFYISSESEAAIVDWSGNYRFEYFSTDNMGLGGNGPKIYGLNRLNLSPKIVPVDGFTVVSSFEVLNYDLYKNSQLGSPFGTGTNRGTATSVDGNSSNLSQNNHAASNLQVRQLYLKINQEYGSIVVGRAPIHFGLGMTFNAGNGLFDHWGDVHDIVGYKFLIDHVSIMPMIGKPYAYSLGAGQTATDMIWNIEYNNPETKSAVGVFYQTRTASDSVNDGLNVFNSVTAPSYNTMKTAITERAAWTTQNVNLFLSRGWDGLNFKMEVGFNSGSTGLKAVNSKGEIEDVRLNGYAVAMELDFLRPEKSWQWSLKTGIASGDNPETANFEGYLFHRNYDLAFLLFNHPMGKSDVFRTNLQRTRTTTCTGNVCQLVPVGEAADEETVSNVFYLSPTATYRINDKWSWKNTFTWAQLNNSRIQNAAGNGFLDGSKEVGFEYDCGFIYKPHEKVQWVNEIGFFNPGAGWKVESLPDYKPGSVFGFQTKAAISF